MKYETINPQLFIQNRKNLAQKLKAGSLAIFNSNDIMPTSADGTMPFKQHSDIFYLSGINQEESILLLCPDAKEPKFREILFVKETNEHIAVWEGHKYSKEEATQTSGIETVFWLSNFEAIFRKLAFESEYLYLNTNEHLRDSNEVQTRDDRFINWCKKQFPLHKLERLSPIMHRLRAVKSAFEVDLIQKACNITEKGFRRLLSFVKANVWEYEIEAELIHEFLRNRADGFAYEPIIASGESACILHYIKNDKICKAGDVLLLDVAAAYAQYNSDLTRCLPVSGRFSKRQKDVYNAVLRVFKEAKSLLVVGNNWTDYHKEVGKIMESELIGLGLLDRHEVAKQNSNAPLFKKYFPHGTSHHLGLNVHDYGSPNHVFESGMVFTCEPGIYILEENLGIRLENNIVITENGNDDLMKNIPIEAEEIEDLMN
ncbi:MAG: M24 family metallopeptidase [Bacteroidetes bacterium]|nr:MAG: M24 family metallopeptidase [Bacteroidota bacterium]